MTDPRPGADGRPSAAPPPRPASPPPEFVKRLRKLEQRVEQVAGRAGNRFSRVEIVDGGGEVRQVLGAAPDGTVTTRDLGGDPPPAPTVPAVTVTPGVIRVVWDGGFAGALPAPVNLAGVDVHMAKTAGFDPNDGTRAADLGKTAAGVSISATEGTWTVRLVARSTAGKESAPSPPVTVDVPSLLELGPKIYTTAGEPAHSGPAGSALWYDADDSNKRYVWDGAGFVHFPVGAAALAAQLLLAGKTLIVGDPVGDRITLSGVPGGGYGLQLVAGGLIKFNLDPSGDAYFAGVLTGRSNNYSEASAGWVIDEDGNASFQDMQVFDQLTATTASFTNLQVQGRPVQTLIDEGATRLVAQGYNDTLNLQGLVDEKGVVELGFTAEPGRGYMVSINGPEYGCSDFDTAIEFNLRCTSNGTAPAYNSPLIGYGGQLRGGPNSLGGFPAQIFEHSFLWYPPIVNNAPTPIRMLMTVRRGQGNGTVGINCVDSSSRIRRVQMAVTSVGKTLPNSMRVNGSQASAPPPPPPPPVQEYNEKYYVTWTASFRQNGAKRVSGGDMYQGYADSFNGNQASMMGFDLGTIRSRLSGSTIKSGTFYILNRHTYSSGGGTIVLGSHGTDLEPATYGGAALIIDRSRTRTAKGGWASIDVTGWLNEVKGSTSSGLVLGGIGSTSSEFYGYWAGADAGDGRPHFWVKYER